ncbi:AlpA family phage regulatory protein [Acidiphilium acidophilum]|uniref:helix-turn-helix transcriptional regulator n=1 Tax=Acidiphilium acidophilum TaxID=76588 RepID=UPI002E8E7636|nr:helix-turn-helix domain-containing protein [Acidiphilium acidophilum]
MLNTRSPNAKVIEMVYTDFEYGDRLIKERDVARLMGVVPRTMMRWRKLGCGPKYVRLGNTLVAYRESDLREWQEKRTFSHSAEEVTAA